MMENKKKVSFLIMAVAIIIIALVIWFVINRSKQNGPVANPNTNPGGQIATSGQAINTSTPGNEPRDYSKFDISKETKKDADAEAVKKMAMSFAERFGSFSNQSNYSNVEDLQIFMTKNMDSWALGYLSDLKKQKTDASGQYYGIITKAISAQVNNFDSAHGQAEVVITCRRQETKGASVGAYFTQNLTIKMAKEDGAWKADSASWQK